MKRLSRKMRGRGPFLLVAGALSAAAIPASAFGAQYGYFVSQQLSATGTPYSAESADLGRVNMATGAVERTFVPAANFVTANGGAGIPLQIKMHSSSRLVAAGDYIYWTARDLGNGDTAIGRLSASGGSIQPAWHRFNANRFIDPLGIAAGGGAVYFSYWDYSTGNDWGIGRVGADGTGEVMNLIPTQSSPIGAIAVDGNTLYWVAQAGSGATTLRSCTITVGTPCTPTVRGNIGDGNNWMGLSNSLAVAGNTAYTAFLPSGYSPKFGAFNLQATPPVTGTDLFNPYGPTGCSSSNGNWLQLTADTTYGYWTGDSQSGLDGYICRRDLNAAPSDPGTNWALVYPAANNANGLYTDSLTIAAPSPPAISAISPSTGATAGGTTVTITGSGFTGATAVTFGGTAAASFTVVSDTQITATTPAGLAGPVAIAVTTASGTDTEAGAFTYEAPSTPATPASPTPPSSGNSQAPTATWVPPTGPEDRAILVNNARVDLAAAPQVETQGTTTTVVTQMTVDEVGRYTVMYIAPKRPTRRASELATATERVPFAKGTKINKRKLKRKYSAVSFTTTKKGAQVTMRALLKRAKGRKLTLRVIYRAPDGTLKESRIRS